MSVVRGNYYKRYIVVEVDSENYVYVNTMATFELINFIGMLDCYDISEYKVYAIDTTHGIQLKEVEIYEPWHNPEDPLCVKGLVDGKLEFVGYAPDH